jgi:hypothetical protein
MRDRASPEAAQGAVLDEPAPEDLELSCEFDQSVPGAWEVGA